MGKGVKNSFINVRYITAIIFLIELGTMSLLYHKSYLLKTLLASKNEEVSPTVGPEPIVSRGSCTTSDKINVTTRLL